MRLSRAGAAVLTSFILLLAMTPARTNATPGQLFDGSLAIATQVAVRGSRIMVDAPPPLPYPTGRCDGLAAGLPGLTNQSTPIDVRLIGESVQSRPIWAEYWGPVSPTKIVLVVGQIHGNECAPSLLVDEIRSNPPDSYGIWLIPTLNPDGYAAYSRRNANNVDLNADGGAASQPETKALFAFVSAIRPTLTVHVHSPNGFVGAYPTGAPAATSLCSSMGALAAMRCSYGGAGYRTDRSRWFLWQGLSRFGGESLLIELRAVSDSEVPTARPRLATTSVDQVRSDAERILEILEVQF
jgi:hypothetical protein